MPELAIATSTAAFAELAPEWDALVARAPRATVFQTHAWLRSFFAHFARDRAPHVLLLREGGRLTAALPLLAETLRWRRLRIRQLVLPTDAVSCNVRSDLLAEGDGKAAAAAIAHHFAATHRAWDLCLLDALPSGSPLLAACAALAAHTDVSAVVREPSWVLHHLPIRGSFEEYLAREHNAHSRGHLRREEKRLQALGEVSVRCVEAPADIAGAMDHFLALETACAKRERADYTPLEPALQAYYRDVMTALAQAGTALVGVLELDRRVVAVALACRHRGVLTTLNEVYDPELEGGRPGHALRQALVRHAFDSGLAEIDFNGYGDHIQRWRTSGRLFERVTLYSGTLYGSLLGTAKQRIAPLARNALPWLFPTPAVRPGDRGLPA